MQWWPDNVWAILEADGGQDHNSDPGMAINELFFWCEELVLVLGARVCEANCEAAQGGRECCDRGAAHCRRDGLLPALLSCPLCPVPARCVEPHQRGLCSPILLGEFYMMRTHASVWFCLLLCFFNIKNIVEKVVIKFRIL